SAGLEEAVKWMILYLFIFKHVEFDEPYDGIVYSVAVSLGFASMENVVYAIYSYSSFGQLIGRALLPVSGHALFGVVMGYYLGLAKFKPRYKRMYMAVSILMPVLYHGIFDYILTNFTDTWLWFMIPLMGYLWIRSLWKVKKANARSPLRPVGEEEVKISV
ncbi:PrsW family glutamic-type intramembrane protease, partial [Gorillibacterium massiliense]|uniref:PrsW family glutamic-type intramembrane protease n=1 Tax=Gorillibacterium massiliense TaxID=1280390 RepID=UPI0005930071